jgi:hypothetical protein
LKNEYSFFEIINPKNNISINKTLVRIIAGPIIKEIGIIEKRIKKKLFIFLSSTIKF